MSLDYHVKVSELRAVAYELFRTVPERAMKQTITELANTTATYLREEAPKNKSASWRIPTPPSLRDTVQIQSVGKGYYVAPMKMVDGLYLSTLLEKGSQNTRIIRAVNKKYMRFYWREQWWFRTMVNRGMIPPNQFVYRAAMKVGQIARFVMRDTFIHYLSMKKMGLI